MGTIIARFMDRWLQPGESESREKTYTPAPGTEISYSPKLINELESEHRRFFELHDSIVEAVRNRRLELVPDLLKEFDDLLTGHLLTERVRLYAYMEAYFSNDSQTREMLRDYRLEMDRIGNSVRKIVHRYRLLAMDSELAANFEVDFAELRRVLEERMSREEATLYPLYMPVIQ